MGIVGNDRQIVIDVALTEQMHEAIIWVKRHCGRVALDEEDRRLPLVDRGDRRRLERDVLRVERRAPECTPARSARRRNMSELRASACDARSPPYDSPQIAIRFGSTSSRLWRYFPPASTSRYFTVPLAAGRSSGTEGIPVPDSGSGS